MMEFDRWKIVESFFVFLLKKTDGGVKCEVRDSYNNDCTAF